jgi:DNA gyrase subunit B
MTKINNAYTGASIKILGGIEHVQKRPALYIGNTDVEGLHHLLTEIIENSIDEATAGFAKTITVTAHKDNSVSVEDDGRGIPTDIHKEKGIPTIDVVMTILNAGGKFGGENSAFKKSSGLHGMGSSIVNALSSWMEVTVKREGKKFFRRYELAKPTKKDLEILKASIPKSETGTLVTFKPDPKYFKACAFNYNTVLRRIRELSFLNSEVTFILNWEPTNESSTYISKGGLSEYVEYLAKNKKLLHKPIHIVTDKVENCDIELAFAYEENYDSIVHSFSNNVNTVEGGIHLNAALDSLTKSVTSVANDGNMLKDIGEPAKSDIQEGLILIVSVKVPEPQFCGQTKTKLGNEELRKPFGDWMQEELEKYFKKNKDIGKLIASKIADAIKARDAAHKAKNLSRKKSTIDSLTLPGKLADCSSKNPELCELFVCEGESGGGTAKQARDRSFQAVLPLKGKVLNVGKATLNKALENKEIGAIVSALGINISSRECDLENLRYHKIILICDADSDGGHITCLLLTLFHNFMRKLIEEGHVYVADLPLYRAVCQQKVHYLKDEEALEEFKNEHPNNKLEITRFKGLGEMDPEPFAELAMNPATRRLKQITLIDQIQAQELLNCLMGDDLVGRKEFLSKYLKFEEGE